MSPVFAVCVSFLFSQTSLDSELALLMQQHGLQRAHVGVLFKDQNGAVILDYQSEKRFIPASVMKVFTCALALELLGKDYMPQTKIWRDSKGVCIKGGGDPGLTIIELQNAAKSLNVSASDTVFYDDSLLGDERYASGWTIGDLPQGYCPSVSALTVNDAKLQLWSGGGRAWLMPRNFGIKVNAVPQEESGGTEVTILNGGWTVNVSGLSHNPQETLIGEVNIPDPARASAMVLGSKIQRKTGLTPPANSYTIQNRSVETLIKKALQDSNNLYAETLLRLTGAVKGKSGSWSDSLSLMSDYLFSLKIPKDSFRLMDGSGISRANEVTPQMTVNLLEHVLSGKNGNVFMRSLASPGIGTLKNRLSGYHVFAKTGTLRGVSCLAGVIEITPQQNKYVFAIFVNAFPGESTQNRAFIDDVVAMVHKRLTFPSSL